MGWWSFWCGRGFDCFGLSSRPSRSQGDARVACRSARVTRPASWLLGFEGQIKQEAIVLAGEGFVDPGGEIVFGDPALVNARQDDRTDQDLAASVVFAFTPGGEGTGTGVDALLPDFELLQFCLEG